MIGVAPRAFAGKVGPAWPSDDVRRKKPETRADGVWLLGRRSFKWFDCAGPVFLIVRRTALDPPLSIGPFKLVRAGAALLWGDDELLWPRVPGWADGGDAFREVSFVETIPDREESLKARVTRP
jgi:hypothetical protein